MKTPHSAVTGHPAAVTECSQARRLARTPILIFLLALLTGPLLAGPLLDAALVDPKAGPDHKGSVRNLTKALNYRDPWALSEDCITAARDQSLVLLDDAGRETAPTPAFR